MSLVIDVSSSSRRTALADILLVVAASSVAYAVEVALQEAFPWGDEARGVLAVLVGAAFAVWVTLHRGRSITDLGFTRPKSWWAVPIWVVGILATFILAQIAAPLLLSTFIEIPQPDFSRYDFIRDNFLGALAMILALPTEEEHVVEASLYTEPFYFAAAKQHPKAKQKQVSLADLEDEEVLHGDDVPFHAGDLGHGHYLPLPVR